MFNEDEDEYIKDIRYLFNENEDVDEDRESPFKSIIFFSIIICLQKRKKKTNNTYNKAPTTMFYVVGGKEKVKNII